MQKLENNEARPKFTGSYFKKACSTRTNWSMQQQNSGNSCYISQIGHHHNTPTVSGFKNYLSIFLYG